MGDPFPGMRLVVVCEHCLNSDKDPAIEINFKDQTLYYVCPSCRKENKIILRIDTKPYPKSRRM
jgi:Zn finger protein HypA/HybF involved in hydrogenase expression